MEITGLLVFGVVVIFLALSYIKNKDKSGKSKTLPKDNYRNKPK